MEKIDEVITLLGWNQTTQTPEEFKETVIKFIDSVLADFPDCHVSLIALQVPSRDGFANNYGVSWPWFEKVGKAFDFQDVYMEIANSPKYKGKVSVISIAGQYDSVYNDIKTTVDVNNRNDTDIVIGSNGVHPTNMGYMQIADAVYRHMIHRLYE